MQRESILYNFAHSEIDRMSMESKVRRTKSKYPEQIGSKTSCKVVCFFFDPAYTMVNASRSWSFRELLEDGSFDWRSVPMERIDPFLVSILRFVDVLRRGYNARTRCQSIWKSVIAFHFMNSNVMRGNEFNARDTYQPGVDLSSVLPFYVSLAFGPFSLYNSLNYASFHRIIRWIGFYL